MRDLRSYLSLIVRDPVLHAKWINTFSYLEYIGFRKIVKSQAAESLSVETLSHAVEEGRHALRLKRLALKIGGDQFDSYHDDVLLCGREAENYFQKLDRYCEASFAEHPQCTRLTYLYVTLLVEIRALEVYGHYQEFARVPAIQGLLAEEEGHLRYVQDELRLKDGEFDSRLAELRRVEQSLYDNFMYALSQELSVSHVAYS